MRYINKFLLLNVLLLAGCSDFSDKKEKLTGERIPAYSVTSQAVVDSSIASKNYSAPVAVLNDTWSASQYPDEVMGSNLSLQIDSVKPAKVFSSSISSKLSPIGQVINKDNLFIVDNEGVVKSFNLENGKLIWKNDDINKDQVLAKLMKGRKSLFGGMSYHNGKLFLTIGFKGVIALDAASGKRLWYKELSTVVRSVPFVVGSRVIMQGVNNNVFALNVDNGDLLWVYWGVKGSEIAPLDAAILTGYGNVVITQQAGNSLHAVDVRDGGYLWKADFYGEYEEVSSMVSSTYIKAVEYEGMVYAVHPTGKMIAINPSDEGALRWEQEIGACQNFWISGDLIFAATDSLNLIAIDRKNGKVKWISKFKAPVEQAKKLKKEKEIIWFKQPIVAGGEVLLINSSGQINRFDYNSGERLAVVETKVTPVMAPIVVNGKLYILSKDKKIHQFIQR